jgi:hypothetical protein
MIANATPASLSYPKGSGRTEWPWWALLFLIVVLLWCTAYNRWTLAAWKTPAVYNGDILAVMANAKAFASGDIYPIVPKYPASLGAPFNANWNDYPSPSEGIFVWMGMFVRLFGIFLGSNLALLSAHLLAAASFYFVARTLGYHKLLSLATAVVFSMSRYAFARNLSHIGPLFYWHVPLALLVVWWAGSDESFAKDRRKIWFCVFVAVIHGIQDVYFSGLFLQFLVLTSLVCTIRRESWSRILYPLGIASVVLATCVVMNLDTFYNRIVNGSNPESLVRNYAGLEVYALKPVELFLPIAHRLAPLDAWTHRAYVTQAAILGEIGPAYLGVVGIIALALLFWVSFRAAVIGKGANVPSHFWLILWIVFFSVIGGINSGLGLFGIILFRGSNRYSIVILAVALLFLVKYLSARVGRARPVAVAALAGIVIWLAFLDQSPKPPTRAAINKVRALSVSDGQVVSALEAALPAKAMIFQLPVHPFPEAGPVREMGDYEHFRPYLQSHSLRFSYGSTRGRTRERWQAEAEQMDAGNLISALESYGFSAILINKKAYEGRPPRLLAELAAAGRSEILCESDDLVCIALHPLSKPILPP